MTAALLPEIRRTLVRFVSGFALPMRCPICGNGIPFDGTPNMFCSDCLARMPFIPGKPCRTCGGKLNGIFDICPDCLGEPARPWTKAFALFQYEDRVCAAVRLLKYGNRPDLARPFGRLAVGLIGNERYDFITGIPLHWTRFLSRGYNQAELAAREISRRTGFRYARLLKRTRRTEHQAFLAKSERGANIRGAFSFCGSKLPRNCAILLADDVMTTGATLAEGAKTLLAAGAARVDVLAIARRQRN